jgi:hypothetical protein
MTFEDKKLGLESIEDLFQCGINTVEPYALMLAPVYVFMKLNEKLVSVKAPLDFFTPDELKHLSRYETFYIPKSVQSGSRFQTAAKIIRNLLTVKSDDTNFSPATYEISNEVMIALFSLWGKDLRVDPFFCAVFADELCGAFNPEKMVEARETAVVRHDAGILLSSVLTFILLHLGYFDYSALCKIRVMAYEAIVDRDESWDDVSQEWHIVARDLKKILGQNSTFAPEMLRQNNAEWVRKFQGRVRRIENTPSLKKYPSLSVSDEEGMSA